MGSGLEPLLERIAQALERLAPSPRAPADFSAARLFRHDPESGAFHPAPDSPLPLESLIGVDRQKGRSVENLGRVAAGRPANHAPLWGLRGSGKSAPAQGARRS